MEAVVIGLGWIGQVHLRTYLNMARHGEVSRVWVHDTDAEKVAAVCRRCPQASPLHHTLPHIASVCVPPDQHLAVAAPLLARGVQVLVEKPLALHPRDARALCGAAARPGAGRLFTGHSERFNPGARAALNALDSPHHLTATRLSRAHPTPHAVDVVRDLMIHDIDLALCLFGDDLSHIHTSHLSHDLARATLRWRHGPTATLHARRLGHERRRTWRIDDARGHLDVDLLRGAATRDTHTLPATDDDAMTAQLQAFLRACTSPPQPSRLATGEQGARALDVALEILRG